MKEKKSLNFKDLCLIYFTKGIPGVAGVKSDLYSGTTARKALRFLADAGHNISALENFFVSVKGTGLTMGRKHNKGPKEGDEKLYRVQQPKTDARTLIQLPLDVFHVAKGDNVFVKFTAEEIIIRPSRPKEKLAKVASAS